MTINFPTELREKICVVCDEKVCLSVASWHGKADLHVYANECLSCGFVQVIDNPWKYKNEGFTENSTTGPRVGSATTPGREYHMCQLALAAIKGDELSVFILGSGLSQDFRHIEKLDRISEVYVSDYDNFANVENFIAIKDQGKRKFDIVIACEVIEHFENPKEDWKLMASNLDDGSIFVFSSNLYDRTPLEKHWYVYIPGHLSYHTGAAIQELCKQNDLFVDFRFPLVGNQTAGPRKRYIIGSKSNDALRNLSHYFANNMFAPSEND